MSLSDLALSLKIALGFLHQFVEQVELHGRLSSGLKVFLYRLPAQGMGSKLLSSSNPAEAIERVMEVV